jgi:hypothetical protein
MFLHQGFFHCWISEIRVMCAYYIQEKVSSWNQQHSRVAEIQGLFIPRQHTDSPNCRNPQFTVPLAARICLQISYSSIYFSNLDFLMEQ